MGRERTQQLLRDEAHAKKHLQDTTEYLDLAIQQHRSSAGKGTEERVRHVARSYRAAIARALADTRLRDFESRGTEPHDLVREATFD
jgi:hypothetical protein